MGIERRLSQMEKNRLYVDASEKSLTLVLESNGKVVSAFDDKPKETLEQMFPLIMRLCDECGIKYKDIDEIYATTGPGSTTGIRMALTQARVFYALKQSADLFGASTYDVLYRGSHLDSCIVILSDRHNTFFHALYRDGIRISDGHVDSIEQIDGWNELPIVYASCDNGAKAMNSEVNLLEVSLEDALQCRDAYRKYTPNDVQDLIPLYTEKI